MGELKLSYLTLFSWHNLALLSDWLAETGELYVDVYFPHSGGGGTGFFIRSLQNLKSLVSSINRSEISITIFRRRQFPLRGVADEQLLQDAIEQLPANQAYEIVHLNYYPEPARFCGSGKGISELRRELSEVFGELVAIGQEPDVGSDKLRLNLDEVFEVGVSRINQYEPVRNQDFYNPYANEPQRYKWIEEI